LTIIWLRKVSSGSDHHLCVEFELRSSLSRNVMWSSIHIGVVCLMYYHESVVYILIQAIPRKQCLYQNLLLYILI
jgi:hypothetical protein